MAEEAVDATGPFNLIAHQIVDFCLPAVETSRANPIVLSIEKQLKALFNNKKLPEKEFLAYFQQDTSFFSTSCFKDILSLKERNYVIDEKKLIKHFNDYKAELNKRSDSRKPQEKLDCKDYYEANSEPPSHHWLTNLDIESALEAFFEINFDHALTSCKKIKSTSKNVYVYRACRFEDLKTILTDANLPSDSPFEAYIPVNLGNRHWVCVKISQDKEGKRKLVYTDSLSGSSAAKRYQEQEIKKLGLSWLGEDRAIKVVYTGRQNNGSTCGDHCIREILQGSDFIPAAEHPLQSAIKVIKNPKVSSYLLRENTLRAIEHNYASVFKAEGKKEDKEKKTDNKSTSTQLTFIKNLENKWEAVEIINRLEDLKEKGKDKDIKNVQVELHAHKKTDFSGHIEYNDGTKVYVKKESRVCQVSTPEKTDAAFRRLVESALAAGAKSVEVQGPHAKKIKELIDSDKKFKSKLLVIETIKKAETPKILPTTDTSPRPLAPPPRK